MKNNNSGTSSGLGFTSVLQIVFIVLKLCKVINWSWLWVLSPTWIMTLIAVVIIVVIKIIFR